MFLLGKLDKPQLAFLLLNETSLRPNVPDTLFEVLSYSIYSRDRLNKSGGGVIAYISDNLNVIYVELIWKIKKWKSFGSKSKRSLLIGSIYRQPSYTKADDLSREANLERVYLLNKETIFLGDVNIDGRNNNEFHAAFTQVTPSVKGTCLDHIYSNRPQQILIISTLNCGLSDHVPIFAVRRYNNERGSCSMQKNQNIRYPDIKQFDENRFKEALSQAP